MLLLLRPRRYKPGDRPPQPQRTFQNTWRARCEDDWLRAFYMFSFSARPPSSVIHHSDEARWSNHAMLSSCMHKAFAARDARSVLQFLHGCGARGQGPRCYVKAPGARVLASWAVCCAGIPWLFANLALASFIKFKDSPATAIAVTVVLGIGCMYFFLSHGRWLRYVSGSHTEMQSHLKVRSLDNVRLWRRSWRMSIRIDMLKGRIVALS